MSLSEYQRKRRFDKTREPGLDATARRAARPMFVVQLHHASRRHYDFRLQVGDALKSWAVPKGPSYDPQVKRMAVEVEDHPLSYASFEGDIPSGEYGAGHVAQFDHGAWTTDGDAEAQLAKGHLRFALHGRKLKGGWHLVRSGKAARQPQWLLFKDADEYAGTLEADDLLGDVTAAPAADRKRAGTGKTGKKRLKTVAAPKRRRRTDWAAKALALAGAKHARIRDAAFAPQLARLYESPPTGDAWVHEIKWDGYRLLVTVVDGAVRLWSRNALEWTQRLPEIVSAIETLGLREAQLDGELIAGAGTKADFNLLQSVLSGDKSGPLILMLFDLPHLQGVDLRRVGLVERKELLAQLLTPPPARLGLSSHIVGDGARAYAVASERHYEGIVSKRADSAYHAGRGDDWRKSKRLSSDEFAVVGYTAPKGQRQGFGSLLLARPDPEHGWVYAGKVGSGFSQTLIDTLTPMLERRTQAHPSVHVPPHDTDLRSARWFAPRAVVEVNYRGMGGHGLLRQPSLKAVRSDKAPADLADSDRAPASRAKPTRKRTQTGAKAAPAENEMQLTSPTRVVFPDRGTTKQDVADYYRRAMDWLLPEIVDRPLSVIRCPQGATRPCFFQKHLMAGLERVDAVPLKEESGARAEYLVVRDAAGLMELVQFNTLEFHPWGALAAAPDLADRMVFDLDPGPGVAWAEVVAAARKIRTLLDAMKLRSYVRTSGGKGLHVVVPLKPACDWSQVKPFAHSFAESMAAAEPLKYVATASKKFRRNKIFIDYLRNGRGATSVASFSLRAREGAPVAMPLRWEELGRIKSGDAFDIDSALRRIARLKAHPWAGIERVSQDLNRVAALLARRSRK
ncbi:MAG: DNA ligase D [Lysobacter sp.]|nr:DNA ligase D [Lysobacter sp.]